MGGLAAAEGGEDVGEVEDGARIEERRGSQARKGKGKARKRGAVRLYDSSLG
jgi:hypothetical protein